MKLLTHSRMACFKRCRKQHEFAYIKRIRPKTDAKALRMGGAFQAGIEQMDLGNGLDEACQAVYRKYDGMDLGFEEETVLQLVLGHAWYWENHEVEYISPEHKFEFSLVNPKTGASSRTWRRAGSIDCVVKYDGRFAIKENKLKSCDVGPDSEVWDRLRIDPQITNYFHAARAVGYDVDNVLYDITRKPSIKPTPVPILDDEGLKIVVDESGNRVRNKSGKKRDDGEYQWKQSPAGGDGLTLYTREMNRDEWGEKLSNDIQERPEYYFGRRVICRTDRQVEEFLHEVWDVGKAMHEAERDGIHYRTVDMEGCKFCAYKGLCSTDWKDGDVLPEEFEVIENENPELS